MSKVLQRESLTVLMTCSSVVPICSRLVVLVGCPRVTLCMSYEVNSYRLICKKKVYGYFLNVLSGIGTLGLFGVA